MRKATVIIIAAIYIASIVIVGVFGLQAVMYDEMIYIDDFEFPETIEGQPVGVDGNGLSYVILTYREGLVVEVEFIPVPADATMRGEVEVEISFDNENNPTAELETVGGYFLRFTAPGAVTVTIKSPDTRKVTKQIVFYVF